jgi:uncharacterized membrane protein
MVEVGLVVLVAVGIYFFTKRKKGSGTGGSDRPYEPPGKNDPR